jgi:hypothetical protein
MKDVFSRFFAKSLFALVSVFCASSFAAMSPIGVSVIPPLQFPTEEVSITGVRLGVLWSNHRNVYGADLGVIGGSTSLHFGGVAQASGLLNYNKGSASVVGLQFSGGANINGTAARVFGIQAASFNNNRGESLLVGVGLGVLANASPHMTVVGVQAAGLYNSARTVNGLQIGLINVADVLRGLQIGLVNIHKQGLFKVCPILNFGF